MSGAECSCINLWLVYEVEINTLFLRFCFSYTRQSPSTGVTGYFAQLQHCCLIHFQNLRERIDTHYSGMLHGVLGAIRPSVTRQNNADRTMSADFEYIIVFAHHGRMTTGTRSTLSLSTGKSRVSPPTRPRPPPRAGVELSPFGGVNIRRLRTRRYLLTGSRPTRPGGATCSNENAVRGRTQHVVVTVGKFVRARVACAALWCPGTDRGALSCCERRGPSPYSRRRRGPLSSSVRRQPVSRSFTLRAARRVARVRHASSPRRANSPPTLIIIFLFLPPASRIVYSLPVFKIYTQTHIYISINTRMITPPRP